MDHWATLVLKKCEIIFKISKFSKIPKISKNSKVSKNAKPFFDIKAYSSYFINTHCTGMNLFLDTDLKSMLKDQSNDKDDLNSIVIFVVESDSGV